MITIDKAKTRLLSNQEVACRLELLADLLEAQHANVYRIRCYRNAAMLLLKMEKSVADIIQLEGRQALESFPGIGHSLAKAIELLTVTGTLPLLERLQGGTGPERVFQTVGGIGPGLAANIHQQLGIETLHELEIAAYDGRLAKVPGMGKKRLQSVQESLAGRQRHRKNSFKSTTVGSSDEPSVAELLHVDREYRQKSEAGKLPCIAPRRFNPSGLAWLPILHTCRGPRHYTVLYSNTAHAWEMGATRDWVIIYRDDHQGDGQWTVITAHLGENVGRRIVRGREPECRDYYKQLSETPFDS
ncbi:MAG: hypothetical protein K2W95_08140 [Candidatus Obscuribacterales bacterium]|nr:hypothetical protein [Candidatus Obscuribacterales bacterium]